MDEITQRQVGAEGIAWVRRGLTKSGLGRLILARYSLEHGVATALVPTTTTEEDAHQFQGGVLEPLPPERTVFHSEPDGSVSRLVPTPSADPYLVKIIQDFLSQGSSHVCVFEDYITSPAELIGESDAAATVVLDGVLYHVLDASRADQPAVVMSHVKTAHSINITVGVLTSLPGYVGGAAFHLTDLIAGLQAIIVDAYDGESYVLWRPSQADPGSQPTLGDDSRVT